MANKFQMLEDFVDLLQKKLQSSNRQKRSIETKVRLVREAKDL